MKLPKPINLKIKKYSSDMSLLKKKFIKVKLSANESALGPSPKALKEYQKVSKTKNYLQFLLFRPCQVEAKNQ